jgi:hypothetical protein
VAGSLSKTAAADGAGGRTQVTGVTAAVLVLVVIVALADLLQPLPRAVLSAIVIQAVWGLMDVDALRRYRRIRRNDFVGAMAAMIGVLLLGPLYGLLFAVGQAVLGLVFRSSRIELDVMGKVPGEKAAWGAVRRHPERRTFDGILVLRLDAPLFWANATQVFDGVLAAVDDHPGTRALLLDLEATSRPTPRARRPETCWTVSPSATSSLPRARLLPGPSGPTGPASRAARRGPLWHSILQGPAAPRPASPARPGRRTRRRRTPRSTRPTCRAASASPPTTTTTTPRPTEPGPGPTDPGAGRLSACRDR